MQIVVARMKWVKKSMNAVVVSPVTRRNDEPSPL
jgi:hypothetical protein